MTQTRNAGILALYSILAFINYFSLANTIVKKFSNRQFGTKNKKQTIKH